MCRPLKIDVSTIEILAMFRPSEIDGSTFEDRCVDLRGSMCRSSKIEVSTYEGSRFRPLKINVSHFGDRGVVLRRSTQ